MSNHIDYMWLLQRDFLVLTDENKCPHCQSTNYHALEVDVGKYREYFCANCNKRFFGPNPSYTGDSS